MGSGWVKTVGLRVDPPRLAPEERDHRVRASEGGLDMEAAMARSATSLLGRTAVHLCPVLPLVAILGVENLRTGPTISEIVNVEGLCQREL
jgi:hypothetical protein